MPRDAHQRGQLAHQRDGRAPNNRGHRACAGERPRSGNMTHQDVVLEGRLKVPAELVLAFITLIWGFTFLIIKIGLAHGGALALVGFRFAMGAALLTLITRPSWPT